MTDWQRDYSSAGPGYKRRMQQERSARANATALKSITQPQPVRERLPAKQSFPDTEHREANVITIKKLVRRMAIRKESPREIQAELTSLGISLSLVAISSLRAEMIQILKLLTEDGLIDETRLERYRHARL